MEQALTVSVSSFQLILALAFQVWLVVFPILILRKLNELTSAIQYLMEERIGSGDDDDDFPRDQ
jgi:hypothetical protein